MKDSILNLMEKHGKVWQKNEQKKQAAKDKIIKTKLYPNDTDIYGEREVMKDE